MSGLKTAKKGVITLIFDVMEKDLNKLAAEAHANAVEKGFWEGKPSNEHFLCLVISELMEAVEADRGSHRNRRANVDWFKKRVENSRICRGLDHEIPKERGIPQCKKFAGSGEDCKYPTGKGTGKITAVRRKDSQKGAGCAAEAGGQAGWQTSDSGKGQGIHSCFPEKSQAG